MCSVHVPVGEKEKYNIKAGFAFQGYIYFKISHYPRSSNQFYRTLSHANLNLLSHFLFVCFEAVSHGIAQADPDITSSPPLFSESWFYVFSTMPGYASLPKALNNILRSFPGGRH